MKLFKIICSISYFLLLGYGVFFAPRRRGHHYNYEINFFPLKNSIHGLFTLDLHNKKEVYNFYLNLIGNIILFIPFPMVLIMVGKIDKFKVIILLAFLFSTSIEIVQYLFQIGLADIDDVILNTTGALIGFFIYKKLEQSKFLLYKGKDQDIKCRFFL
ncbi:MAG: VanZ family protein [Bacteroidota bacterium]|nr:VanZ family protein [Bacteroidota bacterium]